MSLDTIKSTLQNGSPLRIVALGDSLTFGWMVEKGYVHFLEELIADRYPDSHVSIVNRGIPGDTAEGGLHRVHLEVVGENPHLVIIQFGLNDAFCGYSPAAYRGNIESIIKIIKNYSGAVPLLLTSSAVLDEDEMIIVQRLYEELDNAGSACGCQVVRAHEYWYDAVAEGMQHEELVQADGVHPTEKGYRLMAEAIMQEL